MRKQANKDCFGYDKKRARCAVLSDTVCEERDCSFYQSAEAYQKKKDFYRKAQEAYLKERRERPRETKKYDDAPAKIRSGVIKREARNV